MRSPFNGADGKPLTLKQVQALVTPHGAFGFVRDDPKSGLCWSGKYPCTHKGVDLAAREGTPVFAPEAGWVLVAANRNDMKPFSGFGPAFVYMLGEETGYWHLLAHLKKGSIHTAGGGYPTEHAPDGNTTLITLGAPYRVEEGTLLGQISSKNHLHWEVQLGDMQQTLSEKKTLFQNYPVFDIRTEVKRDPITWLKTAMLSMSSEDFTTPPRVPAAEAPASTSTGIPWLLLAAVWVASEEGWI